MQQLVAEIGSRRPDLQKRHPELKTTEGRPRKYYYSEKSDSDEVAAAESAIVAPSADNKDAKFGEHALYPLLSLYIFTDSLALNNGQVLQPVTNRLATGIRLEKART